jgi:hypothetical protein
MQKIEKGDADPPGTDALSINPDATPETELIAPEGKNQKENRLMILKQVRDENPIFLNKSTGNRYQGPQITVLNMPGR